MPDPRRVRGRRYRLGVLLALCLTAVLGEARSFAQIARCAADSDPEVRAGLDLGRDTPNASTPRVTAGPHRRRRSGRRRRQLVHHLRDVTFTEDACWRKASSSRNAVRSVTGLHEGPGRFGEMVDQGEPLGGRGTAGASAAEIRSCPGDLERRGRVDLATAGWRVSGEAAEGLGGQVGEGGVAVDGHDQVGLGRQRTQDVDDAVAAGRSQSVEIGAADTDRSSAQGEGLDDVRSRSSARPPDTTSSPSSPPATCWPSPATRSTCSRTFPVSPPCRPGSAPTCSPRAADGASPPWIRTSALS